LGAGEHKVAAEFHGEPMEIGYNAAYLIDLLRSMETEQVLFRLNNALAAGVVEPVGGLKHSEEDLLCLVMPLRLPDAAG
jgi:DNA polymerase-3 subunit beta